MHATSLACVFFVGCACLACMCASLANGISAVRSLACMNASLAYMHANLACSITDKTVHANVACVGSDVISHVACNACKLSMHACYGRNGPKDACTLSMHACCRRNRQKYACTLRTHACYGRNGQKLVRKAQMRARASPWLHVSLAV